MPIIIQPRGADLFESGADILVNTVNTQGVMGAGIALQFKQRFPGMFTAYRTRCRAGLVTVGSIDVHFLTEDRRIIIANFPTKQHWRNPSQLEWIQSGLEDLSRLVDRTGSRSIAIPPLGCGLGGLEWPVVSDQIIQSMTPAAESGVDVFLYPPARR